MAYILKHTLIRLITAGKSKIQGYGLLADGVENELARVYEYLMNCHPNKYTYHVQVGDGYADHAYWGRPEEIDMDRPTFTLTTDKPGSEPTAEAAAALSTCYLIFKEKNPELAEAGIYVPIRSWRDRPQIRPVPVQRSLN